MNMAKDKVVPVTEDLTGFLPIRIEPGKEIQGWNCDTQGTLLRIITDIMSETGEVIGKNVKYEFKRGAYIDPVCVDDKITMGNLVGGE
jgi:phage gp29-like protein